MSADWTSRLPETACKDAVDWCETQPDIKTAWENCERGEWMLWLLGQNVKQQGDTRHRKLVLTACRCARLAWEWMPEASGIVIEQLEQWAAGDDSVNLAAVRKAAYDAAVAAAAAYAADATYAAAYAADAAAYATDAADAAADAADARFGLHKKCANIVREMYSVREVYIILKKKKDGNT